ncbi:MAG: hypothetical protein J6D06_06095 [Clostridia bacterium]|nr:hypothetical protein [Clostridia bacterium]
MKKICILMSLVAICTLLFSACDKNEGDDTTKNAETTAVSTSAEETTLTAEQAASLEKEAEYAKKCVETLLLSKDADEIRKVIRNGTDEYIQDVITGFPYDDYAVKVTRLGEHKENIIYYVEVERAATSESEEYYYSGIQIFTPVENGLLIELDGTVEDEVVAKFHCRSCGGSGSKGFDEVHKVEYKCPVCNGIGFVF